MCFLYKNISGLPIAHSNVDKEMLTHFPVSLSDTVRPVIDPSSCISLEESREAERPPRHFTTDTVFDLTRLGQKERTRQRGSLVKTNFFLKIWLIYLRTCTNRPITCKQVLFEQDLLCTAPALPLLPGALPAPQELKDEPTSGCWKLLHWPSASKT